MIDRGLGEWLEEQGLAAADETAAVLADVSRIRDLLVAAARAGSAVSYSALLGQLGVRFSRPKMRALCRTLDRIDAEGFVAGEPPLAVLVVREADRLPGQGWWTAAVANGYAGSWTGAAARAHVAALQAAAFVFWSGRQLPHIGPARGGER